MEKEKELDLREFDDMHNEQIAERIYAESEGNKTVFAVFLITVVYMVISTFIWGMFFYRGGDVGIHAEGYLIDLVVIGLVVYGFSSQNKKDIALQTFFGTMLFMALDVVSKNIILYPFIVNLLGM